MKLFELRRDVDETGVSGTGIVAQGVVFDNGWCALTWLTKHTSAAFYTSIDEVIAIHGHEGKTRIVQVADVNLDAIRKHRGAATVALLNGTLVGERDCAAAGSDDMSPVAQEKWRRVRPIGRSEADRFLASRRLLREFLVAEFHRVFHLEVEEVLFETFPDGLYATLYIEGSEVAAHNVWAVAMASALDDAGVEVSVVVRASADRIGDRSSARCHRHGRDFAEAAASTKRRLG